MTMKGLKKGLHPDERSLTQTARSNFQRNRWKCAKAYDLHFADWYGRAVLCRRHASSAVMILTRGICVDVKTVVSQNECKGMEYVVIDAGNIAAIMYGVRVFHPATSPTRGLPSTLL